MLDPLDFAVILLIGACASGIAFAMHAWMRKRLAKYFRYRPYRPDDGHERAAEREERWYPQNPSVSHLLKLSASTCTTAVTRQNQPDSGDQPERF